MTVALLAKQEAPGSTPMLAYIVVARLIYGGVPCRGARSGKTRFGRSLSLLDRRSLRSSSSSFSFSICSVGQTVAHR
jgi:hypothetical protein